MSSIVATQNVIEMAASQFKFKQFSPSQMQVNLKNNLKNTEYVLPLPMLAVTGFTHN
jgi:hypothetical protein